MYIPSKYVFSVAFILLHDSFFMMNDAALSIMENISVSTGVVFSVEPFSNAPAAVVVLSILLPIAVATVVAKFGSSPNALANSLRVSSVQGAASITADIELLTSVLTSLSVKYLSSWLCTVLALPVSKVFTSVSV